MSRVSAGCVLRAPGWPVDLDRYALRVGLRSGQVQCYVRAGAGEQPRALAEDHRDDEQGHLVHEVVVEQPADQGAAAVDLQLTLLAGAFSSRMAAARSPDKTVVPAHCDAASVADATYLGVWFSATPMGWARICSVVPQEPANSS